MSSYRIPDQPNPPLNRQSYTDHTQQDIRQSYTDHTQQDRWQQNSYSSSTTDPGQYVSRTHNVRPAMQDLGTEKITAQTLYGHNSSLAEPNVSAPPAPQAPRQYYQQPQQDITPRDRFDDKSQAGSLRSSYSDFSTPRTQQAGARPQDPMPTYTRYRPIDRTSEQQIDPNRYAAAPQPEQPLRSSFQEPLKTRSSFNERDMPSRSPIASLGGSTSSLSSSLPRKEPGHEEEVHRLRKMLSSASAELGRQISSYQADGRGGDQYRAEWLQKLVLQMEAKQVLLESELREVKAEAGNHSNKVEDLERQNNTLREQQSRILRQTPRESAGGASSEMTQQLMRDKDEMNRRKDAAEREREAAVREKEALGQQLEELSNRYANLQRSFKIMDESNLANQSGASEQRQRLEDAVAQAQQLSQQGTILQAENDRLKSQLANEIRKFESQKVELQKQASEVEAMRRLLEDAQAEKAEKDKEVHSLQARHSEMSKVLSLSRQLEDASGKSTWLAGRLQEGEKALQSQSSALEQIGAHRDRELQKHQGPILTEWREVVNDSSVRLQTLHGLLKSIEVHWNRRFYKNHFLAWKFVRGRAVQMMAEAAFRSNAQVMKETLENWVLETRAEQRRKREGEAAVDFAQRMAAREVAVAEQTRGEERGAAGERERAREEKHAEDIRTLQERGARERADAEARAAEARKAFESERDELQRKVEEAVEQGRAEVERASAALKAAMAEEARKAEKREEGLRAQMDALNKEMEERLAKAAAKGEEVENKLRTQIVDEAEKWARKVQDAHDEQSQTSRELRKKTLDREREHAAQIEEMERKILVIEEGEHTRQKQREREFESQLAAAKEEAGRATDEVVQKMYAKEKEFASRLDATRAEHIKFQEDFHQELMEKDAELARKLADKDAEFKAHLDSLLSNRVSVAIKDLQSKVTEQEGQLAQLATKERTAQDELARLRNHVRESDQSLEDTKAQLEHYQHEAVDARDARGTLANQLNAAHQRQDTLVKQAEKAALDLRGSQAEVRQLQGKLEQAERSVAAAQASQAAAVREKEQLSSQLTVASSSLSRKDGDYSEAMRGAQTRADKAEKEVQALQDKLRGAHATNDRLASELEEASSLLLKLSSDSEGTRQHSDHAVALAKEQAAKEAAQLRGQLDEERSASRRAHSELLDSLAAAHSDSKKFKEQVVELERRCVELANAGGGGGAADAWTAEERERALAMERRLESVEQENDRLTTEMDNILVENAQIREELEDAKETMEQTSRTGSGVQPRGYPQHSYSPEKVRRRRLTGQESLERYGVRLGVTCGVHTSRLVMEVWGRWVEAVMRVRMQGRRQMFSCLEHFTDPDTGVSANWPVGRVRKSELEIRTEKVGSGTFAEVFRGTIKVPCAVKRMRGPMQNKDMLEFIREGEMTRCIDHPFVAKLMGIYQDATTCALLLEYVPGCNVFDYLHKFHKSIPFAKQLAIAVQVCDAMKCIHDHDIIHRDLKPQNIIYQEKTGTAKLCDFGLARILPAGVEELHPSQLGTGGTPAYQAPEVLKRQPVGKRLDQFGFAVTLWEMYTTKLPWSDCNLEQMTARVAIQNERPALPGDMPREFANVLQQCWARETRSRPHFYELHPMMLDMLEAVSPGSKLSSSSSVGSAGSASTASTVHTPGAGAHAGWRPQQPGSGGNSSGPASYPMSRASQQHLQSAPAPLHRQASGSGSHSGSFHGANGGAVYGPF